MKWEESSDRRVWQVLRPKWSGHWSWWGYLCHWHSCFLSVQVQWRGKTAQNCSVVEPSVLQRSTLCAWLWQWTSEDLWCWLQCHRNLNAPICGISQKVMMACTWWVVTRPLYYLWSVQVIFQPYRWLDRQQLRASMMRIKLFWCTHVG